MSGETSNSATRSLIIWIVTLVAVASLLAFAAWEAGPLPGDLLLARFFEGLPLPNGAAGSLLSDADSAVWFLLVAAVAVALLGRRWLDALLVFVASLSAVFMGVVLKLLVARPRPPEELARVYDPSQTHSFPSITASFSVVLLGVIVYLIWRSQPPRPVFFAALGVSAVSVLVMGLSRVYVGEHWASDVLGGWLFGGAWLLVLLAAHRRWPPRRAKSHK